MRALKTFIYKLHYYEIANLSFNKVIANFSKNFNYMNYSYFQNLYKENIFTN